METYWNGMKTEAVRGTAIVAPAPQFPKYWAQSIIGQRIAVVQVNLDGVNAGGGIAYLDNRNGTGWFKVTEGYGGSSHAHKNVIIVEGTFEPARL